VVQLSANPSAKGWPADPNGAPPIRTHVGSNFPAAMIKPAKTMTKRKKKPQLKIKRKKKFTRNIQWRYMARV
jgi:hypothetical protein